MVRANHSATHLLHAALRHRLGTHVTQKGSLVAADYFRFDFSHPKSLSREDLAAVEAEVNRYIRENAPVGVRFTTPDEAVAGGALACSARNMAMKSESVHGSIGDAIFVELCAAPMSRPG